VLAGGVPVLLVPEQRARFNVLLTADEGGRRMAAEYRRHGSLMTRVRGWLRPPSIVYDEDTARRFSWIYDTHGPETVVLSIGGGPGRENPRAVNLNVDAFDSVDIVGDGANIPLEDACVDTVTCNAVIEHVPNPDRVVGEMHRVLKPGGYAQLMIPFVFPYHAYPADFQRYTRSGVLELMRAFDTVELSVLTGPTSAMLVLFREYLRILLPGGNRPLARLLLNGVSGWLTFPIKYLDVRLNRKPDSAMLAAAFYYLGRKK
jgi:SAM-dependent methyltransferase